MIKNFRRFTAVSFLLPLCASAETSLVKITAKPTQIWIERDSCGQYINCDFAVENTSDETLNISRVEVSVFDRAGKLELQRHFDGSGFSPNILLIPNREIAPNQSVLVFNPFFAFEPDVDLTKMRFEFSLEAKDANKKYTGVVEVSPAFYETKTKLVLPLKERLLINSGHDFFAHHRRFDYLQPIVRQIGVASNFMRYAYDFFVVNEQGAKFKTTGTRADDWFGYGAAVNVPGDGKVVSVANDYPEDFGGRMLKPENVAKDPMLIGGNQVTIDHGNGEFSMLVHLKQGSVRVKPGDRVKRGEVIAAVGVSGSAEEPHLHYELRAGPGLNVEGLPSYFTQFRRLLGARSIAVNRGRRHRRYRDHSASLTTAGRFAIGGETFPAYPG